MGSIRTELRIEDGRPVPQDKRGIGPRIIGQQGQQADAGSPMVGVSLDAPSQIRQRVRVLPGFGKAACLKEIRPRQGSLRFLLGLHCAPPGASLPVPEPGRDPEPDEQGGQHGGGRREGQLLALDQPLEPVEFARRPGDHGFAIQKPAQVQRQFMSCFIASASLLFEAPHHDPVQVSGDPIPQLWPLGAALGRHRFQGINGQPSQPDRRSWGLLEQDRIADPVHPFRHEGLGIKREASREQFIEQYTQAVDVGPRINIPPGHPHLLRTHIRRGTQKLSGPGDSRVIP